MTNKNIKLTCLNPQWKDESGGRSMLQYLHPWTMDLLSSSPCAYLGVKLAMQLHLHSTPLHSHSCSHVSGLMGLQMSETIPCQLLVHQKAQYSYE